MPNWLQRNFLIFTLNAIQLGVNRHYYYWFIDFILPIPNDSIRFGCIDFDFPDSLKRTADKSSESVMEPWVFFLMHLFSSSDDTCEFHFSYVLIMIIMCQQFVENGYYQRFYLQAVVCSCWRRFSIDFLWRYWPWYA